MSTAARRERLLQLLHRRASTVPALAQELAVSERTVWRDIAALREAGHDVRASPGRGGGVRVAPDSRPRAVHFEVAEIIGLALSVAILKATPHMPFANNAEAALDRARRALSAPRQRAIERFLRRIFIGRPAVETVRAGLGPVDRLVLPTFERCFTGGHQMRFDYSDHHGRSSVRRIECVALMVHPPAWYVVAWDLDKDASRVFRMDRMTAARVGGPLAERHPVAQVMARADPQATAAYADWVGRPIG